MKRYLFITALLSLVFFASCSNETIVGVDDSVITRNNELLESYKQELIDAEYGWVAYIMTNQGYYRYWMDFNDNGTVNMMTDNTILRSSSAEPDESYFSVRHKQRSTIVFETYSYLSTINDPNDAVSGGTGNLGLETDFEFEIRSYTDGVFDLVGRINRVPARFEKATEEQKESVIAGRLIEEIDQTGVISGGISNFNSVTIGDQPVGMFIRPRTTLAFYSDAGGAQIVQEFPRLEPLSRNIIFDTPMLLPGANVTMMEWNDTEQQYTLKTDIGDLPVEHTTTAPIALNEIFGYEKAFNRLRLPSRGFNITEPSFGWGSLLTLQLILQQGVTIDLSFGKTDEGQDTFNITITIVQNGHPFVATSTYNVTFDEDDPAVFTTGSVVTHESATAEQINGSMAPSFINSFGGITFTMRWGETTPPEGYETETVIEFVSGTLIKGGILMQ